MKSSCRYRLPIMVIMLVIMATSVAQAGKPVIHGIISQGYLKSTDYNYMIPTEPGSFAYSEVMLNFSASVTENIRVGAQVIGRNFGADGNEDIAVDWAYGDWRYRDEFGLRVGKVKTPLGFYNQTRDIDMVRTAILLPQSVYTESFRDFINGFEGISAYGSFGLGETASLEYDLFVGTVDMDRSNFGGEIINDVVGQIYGGLLPAASAVTELKTIRGAALRLNTPLEGLRVGGSIVRTDFETDSSYYGPLGPFSPTMELSVKDWYVFSAEYTRDKLVLAAEFTRLWVDFDIDGLLVPTGLPDPYPPTTHIAVANQDFRGGYYGLASWQFNDWFQLGSYYSVYYPDFTDREGDYMTYQKDFAITARFDVTDYWLIKAEAHLMNGVGDIDADMNPDSTFESDNWNLLGIKSTFYF